MDCQEDERSKILQRTGLVEKTIRYYEETGVLPPPKRLPNGYRGYDEADVERVKFVAGARRLDLSLDDIAEILAMRDRREAPCRVVLDLIQAKADEIAQRVFELQRLENELRQLRILGESFPTDDVDGKNCICHLVTEHQGLQNVSGFHTEQVTYQKGQFTLNGRAGQEELCRWSYHLRARPSARRAWRKGRL